MSQFCATIILYDDDDDDDDGGDDDDDFWFGFMLYIPVNSYDHFVTVSSPNHTFSLASLTKWLTSTSCIHFCL